MFENFITGSTALFGDPLTIGIFIFGVIGGMLFGRIFATVCCRSPLVRPMHTPTTATVVVPAMSTMMQAAITSVAVAVAKGNELIAPGQLQHPETAMERLAAKDEGEDASDLTVESGPYGASKASLFQPYVL